MLYWTGIRVGELLALTRADIDFEKHRLNVSKSYQRLHGEDIIATPKMPKSVCSIVMSKFLCEELRDYMVTFSIYDQDERLFPFTKYQLAHAMKKAALQAA